MKFINSRKVAFGSLGLVVSLFGVNVEGAIAQNTQKSGRYLSNQEIQSFEVEIQAELRSGSRFYLDRRTSLEINQINDFVRAWQKVDPSIAPYLGSWTGFESGVDIYPSSTKGQVCIVSTGIGINQYTFGVGRVSSNKLLLEGEDGKTVIVTKRGILQSGNTINFIVEFGSYNGRNGRSSYIYPRIPRKISTNKLARLGCTTSFPSISTTILSVPTSSKPVKPTNSGDGYPTDAEIQRLESEFQRASRGVTGRGYTDRRQSSMVIQINNFVNDWRKVDPSISPFLGNWGGLEEGLRIYPSTSKGKVCVIYSSYGPNGTQSSFNSGTVSENKLTSDGEAGKTLILKKTAPDREGNTVDFLGSFRSDRNSGVVTAYVFPITLAPTNDARFARLGCTDSLPSSSNTASLPSVNNAIPLISGSSTPVKQANTIARYPTNDDFKKVDRILQASRNPDSLVNLKGNQQDQRRKFQKEWESRNPAAAKFLGSWYTGGKSFYVYPSTSKGGTCVITKDNQGNLDLQIGAVLNKELRYGGGKGFFWIDRENIIASRDSNSGDLYPIYATSEVPELSESTISNMESQKCITTFPYATVAAKLPSPLYENVTDPAFKLGNLYRINGMSKFFRIGLNAFEITDNGQTVKLNSAQVNPNVPTIIITHGWNNNLSSPEFRNLLKAVKENSSMQVLVVDWSQASQTGLPNLDIAATRIEASASKVADLIKKYKLKPSNISLIGHSLGAHLSVDLALELQKRDLGNVKSITLLDPAIDLAGGYQVKELSKIDKTTFIRAFYTSANGSSSLATSANESYNIKFPVGPRTPIYSHGEAITLLANSFQGDKDRNRNCISQQFMKLDEKFPNIDQNAERKRASIGYSKPIVDLYVAYDLNGWLYPKQIVQGSLDINSEKGNCNLDSDFNRMFDSIQYILK